MFSTFTFGGLLKKAGPYAMMAATAGWQEYENWKTTQKLNAVEEKFDKVSFILLNITETTSLHTKTTGQPGRPAEATYIGGRN